MSLEDFDFSFQSDESDYEAEKISSGGENESDKVSDFLELVHLHDNLMCFEHIYLNNAMMDMQYMELESCYDFHSVDSERPLIQDYMDSVFEDVFSTNSSTSFSFTSHVDVSSTDSDHLAQSSILDLVHQLYEEVVSTSSSSPSDDSDFVYEQMTNADETNDLQDEDAVEQR